MKNNIRLEISDIEITIVQYTKYLGLIINGKLNWSNDIDKIFQNCTGMVEALY